MLCISIAFPSPSSTRQLHDSLRGPEFSQSAQSNLTQEEKREKHQRKSVFCEHRRDSLLNDITWPKVKAELREMQIALSPRERCSHKEGHKQGNFTRTGGQNVVLRLTLTNFNFDDIKKSKPCWILMQYQPDDTLTRPTEGTQSALFVPCRVPQWTPTVVISENANLIPTKR